MEQTINKPYFHEICKDEIKDFILELVKKELSLIPEGKQCRRRELCDAILSVNKPTGRRENIRDSAMVILKDWNMKHEQIISLESLGFTVVKGKGHYKMRCEGSPYFHCISATPSDKKSNLNNAFEFKRVFF